MSGTVAVGWIASGGRDDVCESEDGDVAAVLDIEGGGLRCVDGDNDMVELLVKGGVGEEGVWF